MNKISKLKLFLVLLAVTSFACTAGAPGSTDWPLGTWIKTTDEDNGPADSITFRDDGTFATYDDQCREHRNAYFIQTGMIFLVIPKEKGPVALVLVPTTDKMSMSFTSPRTQNNAVYIRSRVPHCQLEVRARHAPRQSANASVRRQIPLLNDQGSTSKGYTW
jgi:hypothetical protein